MYAGKRQRENGDGEEGRGAKKSKPFPTRQPYVSFGQMFRKSVITWNPRSLIGHPILAGRLLDALKYGLIGKVIVPHGSRVPLRVLNLLLEAYTRPYIENFGDDPHEKLPRRCEAPRLHSFANYVSSMEGASVEKLRDYMFSPFILIAYVVHNKRNSNSEWSDRYDRLAQTSFTVEDLTAVMNCLKPKIDNISYNWRVTERNTAWQFLDHGTCVLQMSILLTDETWRLRDISKTENFEGAKFFFWMFLRKNFVTQVKEIPEQCMIWTRVQPAAEAGYEYILGFRDNMKLLRGPDGQILDINEELDNIPDVEHAVDLPDGDNEIDKEVSEDEIEDAELPRSDFDGTSNNEAAAVASGSEAQAARFIKAKTIESALEAEDDETSSSDHRPLCREHLDLQIDLQPEDTGSLSDVFVPVIADRAPAGTDRPTTGVVKSVRSKKGVAYTIAPVEGATIQQQTNALLPMSASSSAGMIRERASSPVAPSDADSPLPNFEHGQLILANYSGWPKWPAVVLDNSVDEKGRDCLTVLNLGSNDESPLFVTEAEAYNYEVAKASLKDVIVPRDMLKLFHRGLTLANKYGKPKTEARGRPTKLSIRLAEYAANLAESRAANAVRVANEKRAKTRGRGRPKK